MREQDCDPRVRPWFKGVLATPPGEIHWTDPYIFQAAQEPGITAAVRWQDPETGESLIVAFDVRLVDLSRFTNALTPAASGYVALLTDDGKVLGVPRHPKFTSAEEIRRAVLQEPSKIGLDILDAARRQWKAAGSPVYASFAVAGAQQPRQAALRPLAVRNIRMVIAVLAPAGDFSP